MAFVKVIIFMVALYYSTAKSVSDDTNCLLQDPAVVNLRKYLEIDTSRTENLYKTVDFLRLQALDMGLEFAVHEPAGLPICVLTWRGTDSSLPSIMLNSHFDVVAANEVDWKYPPFAAHVDENCDVFARGTQDIKQLGIQYLEAIRRLKNQNITLNRDIHVTYMPDEESGGLKGMREFVKTDEFKKLNVGFALDEGVGSEDDNNFFVSYQDRRGWTFKFTVEGAGTGHGSSMPDDVAIEKLNRLLYTMINYRNQLKEAIKSLNHLQYGPYTTMNVNMINGGYEANVIPSTFSLVADMRLGSTANTTEISSMIQSWIEYAGDGTKFEFIRQNMESPATPVDNSNPYWIVLKNILKKHGFDVTPHIMPGTTDSLHLRSSGVPAFGFTPLFNTVPRIHRSNEYINIDVYMKGIEIYEDLIHYFGNQL